MSNPNHRPNHREEWQKSSISENLIDLNLVSLSPEEGGDYLRSWETKRDNTGRLIGGYGDIPWDNSWTVKGLTCAPDPNNNTNYLWRKSDWSQVKFDSPRLALDKKTGVSKTVKYESPRNIEAQLYFLQIDYEILVKICERAGETPPDPNITIGYWEFLRRSKIKVFLVEGAKKAGCLLSLGFLAIAIPGIWMGSRKAKNEYGEAIEGHFNLHPCLAGFLQRDREWCIVFDQDEKATTKKDVMAASSRLCGLLERAQNRTSILTWERNLNGSICKGVDDLVSIRGEGAFLEALRNRQTISKINYDKKKSFVDTEFASDTFNLSAQYFQYEEYEPLVTDWATNFIFLKGRQGTGKTEYLRQLVEFAKDNNRKVLVLTHRILLASNLGERLGLTHVDKGGDFSQGMTFCIDSLWEGSKAKFHYRDWKGAFLILDEIEQVLWHLLTSPTCKQRRVEILSNFRDLLRFIIQTKGKVIGADADLTPISIKIIEEIIKHQEFESDAIPVVNKLILQNHYKPWQDIPFYLVGHKNPALLLAMANKSISQGKKVWIATDGQKIQSKWGTSNLYSVFKALHPSIDILQVDKETVANVEHEAYHIATELRRLLSYQLIISSPVIETGVSITSDLFDADEVYLISHGALSINSMIQSMCRVRKKIPRFGWIAKHGIGAKFGNGSFNPVALQKLSIKEYRHNLEILGEPYKEESMSDFNPYVKLLCEHGALRNYEYGQYQIEFLNSIKELGFVVDTTYDKSHSQGYNTLEELQSAREARRMVQKNRKEDDKEDDKEEVKIVCQEIQGLMGLIQDNCLIQDNGIEKEPQELIKKELATSAIALYDNATLKRDENYAQSIVNILNAQSIAFSEYLRLKDKKELNPLERDKLRKASLKLFYVLEDNQLTPELIIKDDEGWGSKIKLHYYLTCGKFFLPMRDRKIYEQHNKKIGSIEKVWVKDINDSLYSWKTRILSYLELDQFLETGVSWDSEKLKNWIVPIYQNIAHINQALHCSMSKRTPPVRVLSILLSKIGLDTVLLKKQTKPDKTRIRIYGVNPDLRNDGRFEIFQRWIAEDEQKYYEFSQQEKLKQSV